MEAKSLGDMLRGSAQQWADRPAMMTPEGKGFRTITYKELLDLVRRTATVVATFGLNRGDCIAIQSENCYEWSVVDWACRVLGIILVPVYPTLPKDQTEYIVTDCGAKLVIVSSEEQAAKSRDVASRILFLKTGEESVMSMVARCESPMSQAEFNAHIDAAKAEDLATIIYTSGTTGPPKGAMLQHRAFTFICENALQSLPLNEEDVFLSFLPMAHVYERVAGQTLPVSCGACIAYSKNLMTLANDMVSTKPTIMLCVPRFLEATMDKIVDGVKKQPPLRQKMFHWAWSQGVKRARGQFAPFAGLLDGLVGSKIRERTGGRMRFFVSGGAALPPNVAEFYSAFGLLVLQGYGLTETAAASCVNHPDRSKYWTVGEPIPGVEVKIADDGEVLIKGPSRMLGYWNLPEATAEAIDSGGWFHTGDIGEFEGANLKITDRKKDLLVLVNGKKVAPQPIENKLRESGMIAEAVLFGDGNEYVYGLIIPNLEHVAEKLGLAKETPDLLDRDDLKALIKTEVDKVNKGLADFEKVKKYAILHAVFSIESGELTPSLKVKRKVVREKFATVLAGLER